MEKHIISIQRTARFYTLGTVSDKIDTIVYVIHGYAENANSFLKKFSSFEKENVLIVAAEGLSRFYLPTTGEVVASWMTKDERESEIREYCNFISSVRSNVITQLEKPFKEHVIGFSQGTATVNRWVCSSEMIAENVFFIGGVGAHDVDWTTFKARNKTIYNFLGTKDRFYKEKNKEELLSPINEIAKPFELIHKAYIGGHHPTDETLKEIFEIIGC